MKVEPKFAQIFKPSKTVEVASQVRVSINGFKVVDTLEPIIDLDKIELYFSSHINEKANLTCKDAIQYGNEVITLGSFGFGANIMMFQKEYCDLFINREKVKYNHFLIALPRTVFISLVGNQPTIKSYAFLEVELNERRSATFKFVMLEELELISLPVVFLSMK